MADRRSLPLANRETNPVEPDSLRAAETPLIELPQLPLFREEALQHAERRLEGAVILATPLRHRVFVLFAFAIVAIVVVFLVSATYSRKETVFGWIQPEGGIIRVRAGQGGVIQQLAVAEGARVNAGDTIAMVRLTTFVEEGDTGTLLKKGLENEAQAMVDQAKAAYDKTLLRESDLHDKLKESTALVAQARERIRLSGRRYEILEGEFQRAKTLAAAGAMSAASLSSSESAFLLAASDRSQATTALLALQGQIDDYAAQLAEIPLEKERISAQISQAEAQYEQRLTSAKAQSLYRVVAPIDGNVLAMPVEVGQTVSPGESLVVMSSKGALLIADLFIPSRAAGFISQGQDVSLKYQAYPYQKFGVGHGSISKVSKTLLSPQEVAVPGLTLQEPVFRARVAILRQSIEAYGKDTPLQPGMLLTADIIIDRRSLMEWLLDPLYAAGLRQ